jgi:hypothetical protein
MVTGQAEGEVVLQLLLGVEVGAQDILPIGKNAQETVGRVAEFDEAAGFGGGQPRFKEWGRAANLRDEHLRPIHLAQASRGGWVGRVHSGVMLAAL